MSEPTSEATAPVVSVIVPCHNAATMLSLQLEALATQNNAPAFEVIVVDNRSTDHVDDVVDMWRGRLERLQLIRAERFAGVSYARNVGASAARTELLMFCDADDVVSETWIGQGVRTFEYADLWTGSAIPIPDTDFSDVASVRTAFGDSAEWLPPVDDQNTAFPILMGGDFGVTAAVYRLLGGFDQSLPSAGEDNEFAVRARLAGYRVPISPTVRIGYRTRTVSRARRRLQYRAAKAHALIATRYGLWRSSPLPPLWIGLARCVGASMKMLTVPAARRDWAGVAGRFAANLGLLEGFVRYRLLRPTPQPQIGAGLTETADIVEPVGHDRDSSRLTVIVVGYNHARFIAECLDSIRTQSLPADRVIVFDDASHDDTDDVVREYESRHPGFLEYHPNPENRGLTPTLNSALGLVRTEYVTYISADDFMMPDRIREQVALMDASTAELSYSDAVVVDADSRVLHDTSRVEFPWPEEPQRSAHPLQSLFEANWIPAASILMRTAPLRTIGGYDDSIFYEDFELLTRAAGHGWRFAHSESALVAVRRLATSLGAVGFSSTSSRFLIAQEHALRNFPYDGSSLSRQVAAARWEIAKRLSHTGTSRLMKLSALRTARRGARSTASFAFHSIRTLVRG